MLELNLWKAIKILSSLYIIQDLELIQQTFLESNNDLDGTISYILQMQSLGTVQGRDTKNITRSCYAGSVISCGQNVFQYWPI